MKPHIVIIGGGFAGLTLIKRIDKKQYDVTLIDRNNYHSFPPLFYQVASAELDPAGICFPFRSEIKRFNSSDCRYHMGNVENINTAEQTVTTQYETIHYDKLIIAAGTTNNFFGIKELEDKVYTLKSTNEALLLRNEILKRLELASLETDRDRQKEMLRFAVVGGGPTGIEIAGALSEMKRHIVPREYPSINHDDIDICIIEGSGRILGSMSDKSSDNARKSLIDMGVTLHLKSSVSQYDNGVIICSDGRSIKASMVIWTAGVTTVPFNFSGAEIEYGRGHRICVDSCNRVKSSENIYAVGDISIMTADNQFPDGHPQLAQVAIQQAKNLSDNLNRHTENAFHYHNKGSMATIGRNRAVADLPKFHLSGWPAWITWMLIHLISIFGARNKISILINWIWAYFTFGSSLRLLFQSDDVNKNKHKGPYS